jgi:hypothetical protein
MKEIIQHPTYGEIIYTESFWTGKKMLTINGVQAKAITKTEFTIGEEKTLIALKGNFLTGVSIRMNEENIELTPKAKWYEIVISIIPLLFALVWGNSPALCAIFPLLGGALGGALGALFSMMALLLAKKQPKLITKILTALGVDVVALLVSFLLAMGMLTLLV